MDGDEGIFVSGFLLYGVAKLREEAASEFERVHWREPFNSSMKSRIY